MDNRFSIGLLTAFGLESVVRGELAGLGIAEAETRDGRVTFRGGWEDVARCNLALRACDRVVLPLARFPAATFDELYEGARKADFPFPANARIMVSGKSVRSKLSAFEVCASVTKKALIDGACARHRVDALRAEIPFRLTVSLRADEAELYLDTSGRGLSFRGYRRLNGEAAIRETLAAGLVLLSRWRGEGPFADPFCGTGTLPVEAGLLACNIPPNGNGSFDFERWNLCETARVREELRAGIRRVPLELLASDVDPKALSMAEYHARRAGVPVRFFRADVRDFAPAGGGGTVVTNPPYGERLADRREAAALLTALGERCRNLADWSVNVITPERDFERLSGLMCRRRKLYNGGIECTYFQHDAPRRFSSPGVSAGLVRVLHSPTKSAGR